jgi:hypothetical protein
LIQIIWGDVGQIIEVDQQESDQDKDDENAPVILKRRGRLLGSKIKNNNSITYS